MALKLPLSTAPILVATFHLTVPHDRLFSQQPSGGGTNVDLDLLASLIDGYCQAEARSSVSMFFSAIIEPYPAIFHQYLTCLSTRFNSCKKNQSVHVLLPPPLSPLVLHPPHLFIHQQVFIGRAHATRRGTSPGW